MAKVKLCTSCNKTERDKHEGWAWMYFSILDDDNYTCPHCGKQLVDTVMEEKDEWILADVSNDINFLESMIALKESDPIEYQLKMSQFRNQVEQQEVIKKQKNESNSVTCPYCKSTNIHKISGTERAMSVMGLGIFSKKINKSFKCKSCGGTF